VTIVKWTGAHVEAMRTAFRDTQEQFAARLGVSVAVVGKWETRGDTQTLGPRFAEMMDTTFVKLKPEQRQLFFAALNPATDADTVMGSIIAATGETSSRGADDVDRREFATAMVGVAAMAAFPATGHVGVGDARRVDALVDHFIARDQRAGGGGVLADALTALDRANTLLENCDFESLAAEDAFTGAVGKLAIRVG